MTVKKTVKFNKSNKLTQITKTNKEIKPNKVMKTGLSLTLFLAIVMFILAILLVLCGIFLTKSRATEMKLTWIPTNTQMRTLFIVLGIIIGLIDFFTIALCTMILARKSDSYFLTGLMALVAGVIIGGILILFGKFESIEKKVTTKI